MDALARQRRHAKGYLPWFLSYVLLAQALFPIQAHTRWVVKPDGVVVVVCSLLGERTAVFVDDREDIDGLDELGSPACLFSSLLGAAVASNQVRWPDAYFSATELRVDPVRDLLRLRCPLVQAIRAPPLV